MRNKYHKKLRFCIFLNSLWIYEYLLTYKLFINLFLLGNIPILYPLKTPENHRLLVVFRGCKMGALVVNELIIIKGNIIEFIRA